MSIVGQNEQSRRPDVTNKPGIRVGLEAADAPERNGIAEGDGAEQG